MGFLKDFFSGNPWRKIDQEGRFKNEIIDIIGTWEFSKLEGLMQMYKVFEHNFFRSRMFSECPDGQKLLVFVVFINNWADHLVKNGQLKDAEMILRTSIKLKSEGNPAYLNLFSILLQNGCLKEAVEAAKSALKALDTLEVQSRNLGIPIPVEFQLGDMTERRQTLYEFIKASEKI